MTEQQRRRTGEFGYSFAVDKLDLHRDDGRYLAHRREIAQRSISELVMTMISDGRAYVVKLNDWTERDEPDFMHEFGRPAARVYERRGFVVLARRTDAEVSEAIAGMEAELIQARARGMKRMLFEDSSVFDWNGRCWERTR